MTPRIARTETLWAGHVSLRRLTIAGQPAQPSDGDRTGSSGTLVREVVISPMSAVILLRRPDGRLILTRQFRAPALLEQGDGSLVECCAGNVDPGRLGSPATTAEAERAARREAEEETGWRVDTIRHLFTLYTSPGVSTERLAFFVGEVAERVGPGGGLADEGESIETLELGLDEAWTMVGDGRIRDAKTVLLLEHLRLEAAAIAQSAA